MRVLFFCGHKSPYGAAHLEPLLKTRFKMSAVVLGTDERWKLFRERLRGKISSSPKRQFYKIGQLARIIKEPLKEILPKVLIQKLQRNDQRSVDLQAVTNGYKVPMMKTDDVNSERFIEKVKNMQVDLILSAAYPQIFSKELISIPKYGAVNFHPSLLPKYRGAHPHYWVIVKGEEKSGLTAHFMTEDIDDGDIIGQIEYGISDYNYDELYARMIRETPNLVGKVEDFFLKGEGKPMPQDPAQASFFREPKDIDKRIFWNRHLSKDILNLVRGGCAYTFFNNQKILFKKSFLSPRNKHLTNNAEVENGSIIDVGDNSIGIKAIDGTIYVTKIFEKNKVLDTAQFIKEHKPKLGLRFN
jgi:methionyl-tRNA formyltransferase